MVRKIFFRTVPLKKTIARSLLQESSLHVTLSHIVVSGLLPDNKNER